MLTFCLIAIGIMLAIASAHIANVQDELLLENGVLAGPGRQAGGAWQAGGDAHSDDFLASVFIGKGQ